MAPALIIVACLEAVVFIAVVALLLRHFNQAEKAWTVERRELVNRVQKPELIPVQPVERFEVPEREPDEWNKVGQVEISDKWMNGDG